MRSLSLPSRDRLRALASSRLGIDTRALAAFRIAAGSLVLLDLLLRARDVRAFYTDFGVLPRPVLLERFLDPHHLTIHTVTGGVWGQLALFCLAGAFALALLVGYRTRLATLGTWLLLISLQSRNPLVLNGGDVLFRALLFWALFVPLGERWSIDARRRENPREHVASAGTAALLCQPVIVYVANAAFKLSGDLWLSGEAIRYVFSLDQFTVLLGDALAGYPTLLHALDLLWLGLLVASPLLLLLPGRPRAGLAAMIAGGHVGMLLTMRLGIFPLVSIAGLLPFLPAVVWSRFEVSLPARVRDGLARVASRLDALLPVVSVTGTPPRLARWKVRVRSAVVVLFLVLVILWNVQTMGVDAVPDDAEPAVQLVRIDQKWNMFAPDPLRTDGWVVVPATLENGSRVDAFHRSRVSWERPPEIAATYPNERWRKYLVNLWRPYYGGHRALFADYLCRRWNANHETEMENLTVYYMEQPSRPYNETEPINRERLHAQRCPDEF